MRSGDLRAALRHLHRLPELVRVEAVVADRSGLAQLGQQRRALDRPVGERQRPDVEHAHRRGQGVHRAQPVADRGVVEPAGIGVRPRVVRVDGRAQLAERAPRPARSPPAPPRSRTGTPRGSARRLRAGRTSSGPPRRDSSARASSPSSSTSPRYEVWTLPTTSPPSWAGRPPSNVELLHAPADAVARLEHGHVGAARGEVARGGQAGEPGPEHEQVAHSASGCRIREHPQRLRGQVQADLVPLVVGERPARVRHERLEPVTAREEDDHLRGRAQVDEALDPRAQPVLPGRARGLDLHALGPDREPARHPTRATSP